MAMSPCKWSTEHYITWKAQQKLIHCNVFLKTKYRKLYHMKSITKINTLQCLHENDEQKNLSHEKHNRN